MNLANRVVAIAVVLITMSVSVSAEPSSPQAVPNWPDLFNPFTLVHLNLQVAPEDWLTIQNDATNDIEVPAWFWADGESQILVSVRKKSSVPLTEAPGYLKVALKIDINEYVSGQLWHGVNKLSLESGSGQGVIAEGFTANMHHMAAGPAGYGYNPGLASWVTVTINGVNTGVYTSVEQRDRQFLENRGLYTNGSTWLYKVSDLGDTGELEVGNGDSPTFLDLCYAPFHTNPTCATPSNEVLAAVLPTKINMRAMLTLAAVDAFSENPDACFSHGKNFYFSDHIGTTRLYYPWDMDAPIQNGEDPLYPSGSNYADIILAVPAFNALYTDILVDLVTGPLNAMQLHAFLDGIEPVLAAALDADPNNLLSGTAAQYFDDLHNWVTTRINLAYSQLPIPTAIPDAGPAFRFAASTPNPFSTSTIIRWALPEGADVRIDVYDVRGRLVRTLADGPQPAGEHYVPWNGANERGEPAPNGVYFARINAGRWSSAQKIVVAR